MFRTWQGSGIWIKIEAALQSKADEQGKLGWDLSADSTISRAHVHAARARRDSSELVDGELADHALGRSRGGFSTKIHLACDGYLQSVSSTLTAEQAGDAPQLTEVLDRIKVDGPGRVRPRTRPNRVLADNKAYSSRAIRTHLRRRGIKTTIPIKDDQVRNRQALGHRGGRPPAFDTEVYKARNVVERCCNALKHKHGVATRYDKLAVRVANIDRWLKRLS